MHQWVEKADWWDASGGYHLQYIYMARGTGIGVTSGSGYRFAYREPIHLINAAQGYTDTYMVKGVLIALDKNVPDQRSLFLNHVTYDASGNLVATKRTDAQGGYLFPNLAAGTYYVDVQDGTGNQPSTLPFPGLTQSP